jgi:hypothetical protein
LEWMSWVLEALVFLKSNNLGWMSLINSVLRRLLANAHQGYILALHSMRYWEHCWQIFWTLSHMRDGFSWPLTSARN